MKILAADTSTATGSVALLQDDQVLAEWSLHSSQTHNRRLLKMVDIVLQQAGCPVADVDGFAVTTGPGSFTGLRIGLSTMKTLAWSLQKPYVGISSLDALAAAFAFTSLPVCPVLDARKKQIYFALYRPDGCGSLVRQGPYRVTPPAELIQHILEPTIFCGDGWLLYRDLLQPDLGALAVTPPAPYHTIRAAFVAAMARQKILAGVAEDPMAGIPLYVRPSEAELHKQSMQL
jgi:tRNA threonylcarbamoyladenosine biosynthesis protein TsaB